MRHLGPKQTPFNIATTLATAQLKHYQVKIQTAILNQDHIPQALIIVFLQGYTEARLVGNDQIINFSDLWSVSLIQ